MAIVTCIVEGAEDQPFGVFIDRPITLGMEIRPGGGLYVVMGIKMTDEANPKVDALTIRKVFVTPVDPVPCATAI